MGIRKWGKSEPCNVCGLKISISEHILFSVGYHFDGDARLKTEAKRKEFCEQYHTHLRDLERKGLYDYERSFIGELMEEDDDGDRKK